MRARSMSRTEIARELQVSKASISLDMQYLRNHAKESIKEYVTEHLPEQYQVCLTALDTILKQRMKYYGFVRQLPGNELNSILWFTWNKKWTGWSALD